MGYPTYYDKATGEFRPMPPGRPEKSAGRMAFSGVHDHAHGQALKALMLFAEVRMRDHARRLKVTASHPAATPEIKTQAEKFAKRSAELSVIIESLWK